MSCSATASQNEICSIYQNVRKNYQCLPEIKLQKTLATDYPWRGHQRAQAKRGHGPDHCHPQLHQTFGLRTEILSHPAECIRLCKRVPSANGRLDGSVCLLRSPV